MVIKEPAARGCGERQGIAGSPPETHEVSLHGETSDQCCREEAPVRRRRVEWLSLAVK